MNQSLIVRKNELSVAQMMQTRTLKMKRLALGVMLGLALTSQGFAIIRPPYPVKPAPPYRGQFIIIGDDARQTPTAKPLK